VNVTNLPCSQTIYIQIPGQFPLRFTQYKVFLMHPNFSWFS